jgi:hypothetical protein
MRPRMLSALPALAFGQSGGGRGDAQSGIRKPGERLLAAMRAHDDGAIAAARKDVIQLLGSLAGTPETVVERGPVDTKAPDKSRIGQQWRDLFARRKDRHPWDFAQRAKAAGKPEPRLRVSQRVARSYLYSHEAGLADGDYLAEARRGLDYITSRQRSNGVFGYPIDPKGQFHSQIAKIAKEGEAKGIQVIEDGWLVDDLGEGGLQFDNGVCGATLLYGYALTRERRYLESARKAADWAMDRPLVLNWNYNSFSGLLLARLFRATGEERYLDAAETVFRYGVLPGQMENGRWFDQHNAMIQYHSILMANGIEFYLALDQAGNSYSKEVRLRLAKGLDSLAREIVEKGPSKSHAWEALSLDALCLGLPVLGEKAEWRAAANADVNFLSAFEDEIRKRGYELPEPVPEFLLLGRKRSCEAAPRLCLD